MQLATTTPIPLPAPTVDIAIRPATVDDIPAIDRLQKPHSKELGFFPRAQLQGYIEKHGVLVAEAIEEQGETSKEQANTEVDAPSLSPCSLLLSPPRLVAYIAYTDRYLKRDELGIVVQLCVDPSMRRSFIGAALLKAAFERSSYGCRLFCCWCAQDLAANRFWESMGFSAIAFRTGSATRGKGSVVRVQGSGRGTNLSSLNPKPSTLTPRIHIFWQKRIRAGDAATPFWFPSKTEGGALREDRIILPIPPGVHWSDVMPAVLPTAGPVGREETERRSDEETESRRPNRKLEIGNRKSPRRVSAGPPVYEPPLKLGSMLRFAKAKPQIEAKVATESTPDTQPVRTKRAAKRCASTDAGEAPAGSTKRYDPTLLAKARELRDRWMEQVDRDPSLLLPTAKYDVARLIAPSASHEVPLMLEQRAA